MNPVRIKDNQQGIREEDFSNADKIKGKILNKNLDELRKEGIFVFPESEDDIEGLSKEQKVLEGSKGSYKTGNVMGFLGLGEERLFIGSRFDEGDKDHFLSYMLTKILGFPSLFSLHVGEENDKLYRMLLFMFPFYLKEAMRKGLYKQYIRHEYNDFNVKGNIDITRHIKKNTPFLGKIAYSQREYSHDNGLTQLIRHTIEYIKGKQGGRSILSEAKDEVRLIIEATPNYRIQDRAKVISDNVKDPIRHAYYKEYRELQRLCLMILRQRKHGLGLGKRQILGVLFDGSWLWEEYVFSLVRDHFYHPNNRKGEGRQYLFGGPNGPIYPDFIGRGPSNRIIGDAKYKPFENINGKDYLQLLAYMFRFDSKNGYYFYPEHEQTTKEEFFLNQGISYEGKVSPRNDIKVIKLGLGIPQRASNQQDFASQMESSESSFLSNF